VNITPFAYAATLSSVVHIALLASLNTTDDPTLLDSRVLFGTSLDVTLVMETLDKGETPNPSTASTESTPMEATAKAIDPTPREVELQSTITELEMAMESHKRQNLALEQTVEQLRKHNRQLENEALSSRQDHARLNLALDDAREHNERLTNDNARLVSELEDTAQTQSTLATANARLTESNTALDHQLHLEKGAAGSLDTKINAERRQSAVLAETVRTLESERQQLQHDLSAASQRNLDLESTIFERDATIEGLALKQRPTMTTDAPLRQALPNETERIIDEQTTAAHKLVSVYTNAESLQASATSTTRDTPKAALVKADPQSTAAESFLAVRASSASPETGNAERDSTPRQVSGNKKPIYPVFAKRYGTEGEVQLKVSISPSGRVDTVTIQKSSGSDLLDKAAVTAVRTWRYHPAVRDGQPVATTDIVPVIFQINSS
jgi:TonB family protein